MRIIQLFLISAAILLAGALTACVAAISGKDFYNLDVPLTQKATDTEYCSAYASRHLTVVLRGRRISANNTMRYSPPA